MKKKEHKNETITEYLLRNAIRIPESGCWLWEKGVSSNGYGQAVYAYKKYAAHRLSYRLFNGEIPNNLHVCHRCDVKSCINPNHLFVGTHKDNMQDKAKKGKSVTGEQFIDSKLTESSVKHIRESGLTVKELAKTYGVALSTIYRAKSGKTWFCVGSANARAMDRAVT